jgi:hypothetical protein
MYDVKWYSGQASGAAVAALLTYHCDNGVIGLFEAEGVHDVLRENVVLLIADEEGVSVKAVLLGKSAFNIALKQKSTEKLGGRWATSADNRLARD